MNKHLPALAPTPAPALHRAAVAAATAVTAACAFLAVSYTHLTLPTILLV